jgi:hypothetical protein
VEELKLAVNRVLECHPPNVSVNAGAGQKTHSTISGQ